MAVHFAHAARATYPGAPLHSPVRLARMRMLCEHISAGCSRTTSVVAWLDSTQLVAYASGNAIVLFDVEVRRCSVLPLCCSCIPELAHERRSSSPYALQLGSVSTCNAGRNDSAACQSCQSHA